MERQIIIKYNWWRVDREPIDDEHMVTLEGIAEQDIFQMIDAGWVEGILEYNIKIHDTDPEDGVEYRGSWEYTRGEDV